MSGDRLVEILYVGALALFVVGYTIGLVAKARRARERRRLERYASWLGVRLRASETNEELQERLRDAWITAPERDPHWLVEILDRGERDRWRA